MHSCPTPSHGRAWNGGGPGRLGPGRRKGREWLRTTPAGAERRLPPGCRALRNACRTRPRRTGPRIAAGRWLKPPRAGHKCGRLLRVMTHHAHEPARPLRGVLAGHASRVTHPPSKSRLSDGSVRARLFHDATLANQWDALLVGLEADSEPGGGGRRAAQAEKARCSPSSSAGASQPRRGHRRRRSWRPDLRRSVRLPAQADGSHCRTVGVRCAGPGTATGPPGDTVVVLARDAGAGEEAGRLWEAASARQAKAPFGWMTPAPDRLRSPAFG